MGSSASYIDIALECIAQENSRTGCSLVRIKKFVGAKKGATFKNGHLNLLLKKAVASGKLIRVKGSFKAGPPKKTTLKKTAPTVPNKAATKTAGTHTVAKKATPKKTTPKKAAMARDSTLAYRVKGSSAGKLRPVSR